MEIMAIEEIGDAFMEDFIACYSFNMHLNGNEFKYFCKTTDLYVEIQYSIQGDESLTIYSVSCLSKKEQDTVNDNNASENGTFTKISKKGIFTNMIQYLLTQLSNPRFRVVLMNVMIPTWFTKLRERGWKSISKRNESLNFNDCDNTSLYMTLETC